MGSFAGCASGTAVTVPRAPAVGWRLGDNDRRPDRAAPVVGGWFGLVDWFGLAFYWYFLGGFTGYVMFLGGSAFFLGEFTACFTLAPPEVLWIFGSFSEGGSGCLGRNKEAHRGLVKLQFWGLFPAIHRKTSLLSALSTWKCFKNWAEGPQKTLLETENPTSVSLSSPSTFQTFSYLEQDI